MKKLLITVVTSCIMCCFACKSQKSALVSSETTFWFSDSQLNVRSETAEVNGERFFETYIHKRLYTEICHGKERPNWKDAILVYSTKKNNYDQYITRKKSSYIQILSSKWELDTLKNFK